MSLSLFSAFCHITGMASLNSSLSFSVQCRLRIAYETWINIIIYTQRLHWSLRVRKNYQWQQYLLRIPRALLGTRMILGYLTILTFQKSVSQDECWVMLTIKIDLVGVVNYVSWSKFDLEYAYYKLNFDLISFLIEFSRSYFFILESKITYF